MRRVGAREAAVGDWQVMAGSRSGQRRPGARGTPPRAAAMRRIVDLGTRRRPGPVRPKREVHMSDLDAQDRTLET